MKEHELAKVMNVPDAYNRSVGSEDVNGEIRAIPNGVNKVSKRIVKGVLSNDTTQNKQR